MQNLLTSEYKKNIRGLYRGRVFTVALFMVCVISLVSLVLLSALSFLLYATSSDSIEKAVSLGKNTNGNTTQKEYNSFFKDLSFLPTDSRVINFSDVLLSILDKKEAGVYLRDLSFSLGGSKDNAGTVTLRGTATTRPLLVSFTEDLRSESLFLSVDSPVSNLLKEQNLDFSLTITLKQATTTNAKKS